jgi:UDP-N-acetyl-D-galactosamine dehydrogenase
MIHAGHNILGTTVTVLGLTFKEDCPDLRNSKVIDIIRELADYGLHVQVHDPLADPAEAAHEYGVKLVPFSELRPAAAVVVAVSHKDYLAFSPTALAQLMGAQPVLIDVKAQYDRQSLEQAGMRVWRL